MSRTPSELADEIDGARVLGDGSTPLADVAYDSRAVVSGALFFCVPGSRADGHDFASEAIAAGAAAIVVERELEVAVTQIVVPSVRGAMGPLSAAFFGHPSRALELVGVTGTNGKTTTVYMLHAAFRALGMPAGLIGNIERRIGDDVLPVTRNTPEAPDLQRLFARMRDARARSAAMEVTSEGIAEGRVEGTTFACSVFTNLTQDHLNYHGTMDAYFEAKTRIFTPGMTARAVVNAADPWGRRLLENLEIPVVTFAADGEADVRLMDARSDREGSDMVADVNGTRISLRVRIPAPFNVTNALGVLAVGHALGYDLDAVARGIASLRGVPGRVEPIEAGQDFTVLVDYAHTPDSLENVLRAARAITPEGANLVVVFGCGGDRDRTKRLQMGRVAVTLADRSIITSDNPRSEDPIAIIREIEEGARAGMYQAIAGRRDAIAAAVRDARAGDVIVIAGKGHETGQEFADHTIPFDDRVVAREILESL